MTVTQFARVVEIRTKVISLSSLLIGTLFAAYAAGRFSLPRFLLMAVAALAVDMGTTAFNTFFDFIRGVDDPRFNRETDKVLVHEGVPPLAALLVSAELYAVALVYGSALAVLAGRPVAIAGGFSLVAGFLYNGGPLPLSRTPLGEFFAGGFLGPVLILLACYVQAGAISIEAVAAALPSFLLIASVLTVNNTCDIEGDRAAGRRTLSIRLGRRAAAALLVLQGAAAFLAALLLAAARILPPASLLLLPPAAGLAAVEYRRMLRRGFAHATKGPSMRGILRVFTLYSLAVVLALAAGLLA
jgi:1,4-dihydroxy-2-naphthoate octaprenyltransferase